MIPVEQFYDAFRERLRMLRQDALEACAVSLQNARNTDAIINSGRALAFEECFDLIHDIVKEAQGN